MPKFDKSSLGQQKRITLNEKKCPYFPPPEDQMTQREVAEMFGRSVQTVINWGNKGMIPLFRIGRRPIYSRKQLIAFASRNQTLVNVEKA